MNDLITRMEALLKSLQLLGFSSIGPTSTEATLQEAIAELKKKTPKAVMIASEGEDLIVLYNDGAVFSGVHEPVAAEWKWYQINLPTTVGGVDV